MKSKVKALVKFGSTFGSIRMGLHNAGDCNALLVARSQLLAHLRIAGCTTASRRLLLRPMRFSSSYTRRQGRPSQIAASASVACFDGGTVQDTTSHSEVSQRVMRSRCDNIYAEERLWRCAAIQAKWDMPGAVALGRFIPIRTIRWRIGYWRWQLSAIAMWPL